VELKVSEIKKRYGTSKGEPVFTLELPPMSFESGSIVFVMGHNGSGKSVYLKLMAGEILPSNGFVHFAFGEKSWRANESPSGIVRQRADDSLAMDLSVRENLLLRGLPNSFMDSLFPAMRLKDQVKSLVSTHAELNRKLDQACRNLSGGQRQALAFLTVTSRNYPVLFLDEFLAATDSHTTKLLRRLAKEYAERVPACVFVASHDVHLALADAGRILVLREGRLIRDMHRNDPDWEEGALIHLLIDHTAAS